MTGWLFLAGAILSEVAGALSLNLAAAGGRRWYVAVGLGYLSAFALLSLALDAGLNLGVAYGVWAATGVALVAIASRVFFREPLTTTMLGGIVLVVLGVIAIELGATH